MGQKGWHRRGYLPHLDGYDIAQHVVFRLHDALPPGLDGDDELDRGLGSALLADPRCADIVEQALLYYHERKYALHAWCVMPNHVHVLVTTTIDHELGAIVEAWKGFSAKQINKLLGCSGQLWAVDYFDRFVRDQRHYETSKAYIEANPVKAGLCERPEDWPFSSARR